ncbi:MAG: hypothetical protein PHX43_07245 [Alphaproteobacteria bacterium]|nr:hypothetical protein [Alphaproteobacteria bacterium]
MSKLIVRLTVFALSVFLCAQAHAAQKAIGTPCSNDNSNIDWDTIGQCNGTVFQKGPLMLGTVATPTYATTTCDAAKTGMIQWTGTSFKGCDGASWSGLGGGALGVSATNTSPSRNGDITTGLFSDTASTVSIATAGVSRLTVTASGNVTINGTAAVGALTVGGQSFIVGGRSSADLNTLLTSGMYGLNGTPTNSPVNYGSLITANNIDTTLQIAGGYQSDNLYFRGSWSSGGGFSPWRTVLHSGNYTSYSPSLTGSGASGTWGISITGSSPLLANLGTYVWSASTLPTGYNLGIQTSFVSGGQSFPSYGSLVNVNTYSGGGGALQLYVPYSPTYGGTGLQVRFGNYDVSSGNSWTAWKTLVASDNVGSYAVPTANGGLITGAGGGLYLGSANWDAGSSGSTAGHIITDNGSYKALMIVGNSVSGNSGMGREIKVWDYLNVQGSFNATGGGTFSGNVSAATPTAANHLATKAYVDSKAGGGTWQSQTFTSSGTWYYSSAYSNVTVFAVGGGGGGGAGYFNGSYYYGGSGGGGAATGWFPNMPVTGNLTVNVGAGGAGGNSSAYTGGNGGTTTVYQGGTLLASARGGGGGSALVTSGSVGGGTGGSGGLFGAGGGGGGGGTYSNTSAAAGGAGGSNNIAYGGCNVSGTGTAVGSGVIGGVGGGTGCGTGGAGGAAGYSYSYGYNYAGGGGGGSWGAGGAGGAAFGNGGGSAGANTGGGGGGGAATSSNGVFSSGGAGGSGLAVIYWQQ